MFIYLLLLSHSGRSHSSRHDHIHTLLVVFWMLVAVTCVSDDVGFLNFVTAKDDKKRPIGAEAGGEGTLTLTLAHIIKLPRLQSEPLGVFIMGPPLSEMIEVGSPFPSSVGRAAFLILNWDHVPREADAGIRKRSVNNKQRRMHGLRCTSSLLSLISEIVVLTLCGIVLLRRTISDG